MVLVQIEATNRWDALALSSRLSRYHWYLIEPDAQHWDVCVPVEQPSGALPDDLRQVIETWLRERNLHAATVRTESGGAYRLTPDQ